MRVTFLLPRYGWQPNGGYTVVYTYANLLAVRGHAVSVVHPRRLPAGGWPRPRGVVGRARRAVATLRDIVLRPRLRWFSMDPRVQLSYVPELSATYVPDADAVIATWWSTAEAALALPRSKGKPYHLIQGYEIWHGAEARVHAAWRGHLHKIFIAEWLRSRAFELGVERSMTSLIPNAIDLDVFRVLQPIAHREPRVAMLYSNQAYKNGALGLEMLERAKAHVPALTATFFGLEPAPARLPPWVTYVRGATAGRLATDVYNTASVYLCPSLSEGWHLPPAEAMACGCALISSDIGGVADYAVDGETALLYPPGDATVGAERLVQLLNDDPARVALAERGRRKIAEFSWARSVIRLEALLERGTMD
ncbi:MAG TPA: glycosyltransferase family 4 protein [Longimicrobiales bacterium]|nr:glycosyltransferase family 4 protein [Longimicrobiales bacterium]